MKKIIATTTINSPTEALMRFDSMEDWTLIVAGDLKTPNDFSLKKGIYITPQMQERYDRELSDTIGWNCIQRRNFALLWAHDLGADVVALVDDDNTPDYSWGKNLHIGRDTEVNYYETELPSFDPLGATNESRLWHRGFPLQLVSKRDYGKVEKRIVNAVVQADLWNGDPDVDAICRMLYNPSCTFREDFFPMAGNSWSPFNSQNTFISGAILKNYFLFPHIGRMDDIWASYYLQSLGHSVLYEKPSVFQKRNKHDLTEDMKKEYLGYEKNLELIGDLRESSKNIKKYLPGLSRQAFELYQKHF